MDLKDRVARSLGDQAIAFQESQGDLSVEVPKGQIVQCLNQLKGDPDLALDFLSDVVGVDNSALYLKAQAKKKKAEGEEAEAAAEPLPPRFDVIYLLLSLKSGERLQVRVRVPEEDAVLDSVTSLWKAANWPEREIYDLLGIGFRGHPNLKRLLMWDGFPAYPLRKDYPLEGQGEERHLFYPD